MACAWCLPPMSVGGVVYPPPRSVEHSSQSFIDELIPPSYWAAATDSADNMHVALAAGKYMKQMVAPTLLAHIRTHKP